MFLNVSASSVSCGRTMIYSHCIILRVIPDDYYRANAELLYSSTGDDFLSTTNNGLRTRARVHDVYFFFITRPENYLLRVCCVWRSCLYMVFRDLRAPVFHRDRNDYERHSGDRWQARFREIHLVALGAVRAAIRNTDQSPITEFGLNTLLNLARARRRRKKKEKNVIASCSSLRTEIL